tara:strand:+ start:197997 stop:199715 length:1719 start_codon:yes stop_codon:yes gene_type:complete
MMDDTRSNSDTNNSPIGHGVDGPLKLAAIDHEEYDALADLFLGDGGYAPEPFDVSQGNELGTESDSDSAESVDTEPFEVQANDIGRSPELPNHKTHSPVLQLTRHEDDADLGSLPSVGVDLGGMDDDEFEVAAAGLRVLETLEMSDARAAELLAELMLDGHVERVDPTGHEKSLDEDVDHSSQVRSGVMPVPCVEVVVLGHLPVRASLWARQYACSRSREGAETVALIRAAAGSTSVDLISGGEPIRTHSYTHLQGALQAVSDFADRVVLRVDEGSEPALLERPEIDEITILTGADEAAVVASYRLIKTLDATLGEQFGKNRSESGPSLRLAVMGASVELASDACMKLESAVETFIKRDVEIVVGSGRIDATGTTNLYRDSVTHPPAHILDGLVDAARDHADQEDRVVELPRVEFPKSSVEVSELRSAKTSDKPSQTKNRKDANRVGDGLCALIPGLKAIEARCPKASGVELGVDEDGRLHLVVCDDDTVDAMNRLLAAQSWARNNFGLLVRAESSLAFPSSDRDVDADALMHLISAEPRGLSEIYDTEVSVYALARVRVGKVIAQVATPIN